MTPGASQAPSRPASWQRLASAGLLALVLGGCLQKGKGEVTGSIPGPQQASAEAWKRHSELWAPKFEANPGDAQAAIQYARALRALGQRPQAVAVLQQAAVRSPNNPELLADYGKALTDVGRYKEASEVLSRAHTPERPDWRVLSAQGSVADQTGDHALAQKYYESALKIAPDEPSVMSNLGLSLALAKRLPEAERWLRQASEHPKSDARMRQNLALVLSLQGKFGDAETVLKQDLAPEDVAATMADLRSLVAQPNAWSAIRKAETKAKPKT
ncbi:MAG TPA: tetratricopeptide repeat protein [Microvirga sp.]|jgi:Flp pilus assembly protein TadD|nr:tetratricopeptide repeat protein [Microvirga sp.]